MDSIPLYLLWFLSSLHIFNADYADCHLGNTRCLNVRGLNISECLSLSPSFIYFLSGHYVCDVHYSVTNVTLDLSTQDPTAIISLEKQQPNGVYLPIVSNQASPYNTIINTAVGSTNIKILIAGGMHYDLIFQRPGVGNNYASSLNVSNCVLTPKFNKNHRNYNCTVNTDVTDVQISYAVEDRWVQQDYSEGGSELEFFKVNKARVVIIAQNDDKGIYYIEIFRRADPRTAIHFLEVPECLWEPLKPKYNSSNPAYYYECRILNNVSTLFLQIRPNSTRASLYLNESNKNLRVGTNDISMEIVAHDKIHREMYNFFVIRQINASTTDDSELIAMEFPSCNINRLFRTQVKNYMCLNNFSNSWRILTTANFTLEKNDPAATWFLEGANPIKPFGSTINVTVVSEDSSTTTRYQIDIYREPSQDASLKTLNTLTRGLGGEELTPSYDGCHPGIQLVPGKYNYTCEVDYLVRTMGLLVETTDPDATVTPRVQNLSLQTSSNMANFSVVASNLVDYNVYWLNMIRGKPENNSFLSELSINGCTMSVSFDKHTTSYSCIMTNQYDSLYPTFTLDSTRSRYILSYPLAPADSSYAFFGRNQVRIIVTGEDLHVRTYEVFVTRIFDSSITQQVSMFTDMLVVSTEWNSVDSVGEDPKNTTQMMKLLDRVVVALDQSSLPLDVPKNRIAVVGIRPGTGTRLTVDLGIIPYTHWSTRSFRPLSNYDDNWVATHLASEFVKYRMGGNANFDGPSIHLLRKFQSFFVFSAVKMPLLWPVNYRVSQVLGSTSTGNPSSVSTLSTFSLPGCNFNFIPATTSYSCLTDNTVNDPGQLVFTLQDPVYSIFVKTIPTSQNVLTGSQKFYFGRNVLLVNVTAENGILTTYRLDLTRSFLSFLPVPPVNEIKLFTNLKTWTSTWYFNTPPLNDLSNINTNDFTSMKELVDTFLAYLSGTSAVVYRNRLAVVAIREYTSSSLNIELAIMPYIGPPVIPNISFSGFEQQYLNFLNVNSKTYVQETVTMEMFDIIPSVLIPKYRVSQVLGETPGGEPSRDSSLVSLSIDGCTFESQWQSQNFEYFCMMTSGHAQTTVRLTPGSPGYATLSIHDTTAMPSYNEVIDGTQYVYSKNTPLSWGYNEITIVVKSEDDAMPSTTYTVYITRTTEPDFNSMCVDDPEGWFYDFNTCVDYKLLPDRGCGTDSESYGLKVGTKGVRLIDACCHCGGGKTIAFVDRKKKYSALNVFTTSWNRNVINDNSNTDVSQLPVNTIKDFIDTLINGIETGFNQPTVPRNRLAVIGLRSKSQSQIEIDIAVMPCTEQGCTQKYPKRSATNTDDIVSGFQTGCNALGTYTSDAILGKLQSCVKTDINLYLFKPTWRVSQVLGITPKGYPYTLAVIMELNLNNCEFRDAQDNMNIVEFSRDIHEYYCLVPKGISQPNLHQITLLGDDEYFTYSMTTPSKLQSTDQQGYYFGRNEVRITVESETGDIQIYTIFVIRTFEDFVTGNDITVRSQLDMEYLPTFWNIPVDTNNPSNVLQEVGIFINDFDQAFQTVFNSDINRIEVIGVRRALDNTLILDLVATTVLGSGQHYSKNQILRIVEDKIKNTVTSSDPFLSKIANVVVSRSKMNFVGIDTNSNGTRTDFLGGKERIIQVVAPTAPTTDPQANVAAGSTVVEPGYIILIVFGLACLCLCVCAITLCYTHWNYVKTFLFGEMSGFEKHDSPHLPSSAMGAPGIDLDQL